MDLQRCCLCACVLRAPPRLQACGHGLCDACVAFLRARDVLLAPPGGVAAAVAHVAAPRTWRCPVPLCGGETGVGDELEVGVLPPFQRGADAAARSAACGECDAAPATRLCTVCAVHYCAPCAAAIHSARALQAHVLLPLAEGDAAPAAGGAHAPGAPRLAADVTCALHHLPRASYCTGCGAVVCAHCVRFGDHRGHATVPLTVAAADLLVNLQAGAATKSAEEEAKRAEVELAAVVRAEFSALQRAAGSHAATLHTYINDVYEAPLARLASRDAALTSLIARIDMETAAAAAALATPDDAPTVVQQLATVPRCLFELRGEFDVLERDAIDVPTVRVAPLAAAVLDAIVALARIRVTAPAASPPPPPPPPAPAPAPALASAPPAAAAVGGWLVPPPPEAPSPSRLPAVHAPPAPDAATPPPDLPPGRVWLRLRLWGAGGGGGGVDSAGNAGGSGGFAAAEYAAAPGERLVLVVGGGGGGNGTAGTPNGGAATRPAAQASFTTGGGGGGSTHVVSVARDGAVILGAGGGGGGAATHTYAGAAAGGGGGGGGGTAGGVTGSGGAGAGAASDALPAGDGVNGGGGGGGSSTAAGGTRPAGGAGGGAGGAGGGGGAGERGSNANGGGGAPCNRPDDGGPTGGGRKGGGGGGGSASASHTLPGSFRTVDSDGRVMPLTADTEGDARTCTNGLGGAGGSIDGRDGRAVILLPDGTRQVWEVRGEYHFTVPSVAPSPAAQVARGVVARVGGAAAGAPLW